jgi:hypothetical protein
MGFDCLIIHGKSNTITISLQTYKLSVNTIKTCVYCYSLQTYKLSVNTLKLVFTAIVCKHTN